MFKILYFIVFCTAFACVGFAQSVSPSGYITDETRASDCVILLHGLARSKASMLTMKKALERQGFTVVNHGYPSRSATILKLAEQALPKARAACVDDPTPDVVTHSMGGILLRAFAEKHPDIKWGRVVMLSPPNHGSGIVDAHGDGALFQWLNGPAAIELKTGGLPDQLPPVPFETGIIAGSQSLNPLTSRLIEGVDDGKVSIESSKVDGMAAHITLPVTHTFMMHNPKVIANTLLFLRAGVFKKFLNTRDALKYSTPR